MGDTLTERVIGCVIKVHNVLGPGFLEGIYRRALLIELRKQRLVVETECDVPVHYDGHEVGRHRLDLLVAGQLILELKAVDSLCAAHYAQVRSYLKATGLTRALLINFSGVKADFRSIRRV